MDPLAISFINKIGITFDNKEQLLGQLIVRDTLLDNKLYEEIQKDIPNLKKIFSSSSMNSLHKNAKESQKWPLINITRQILKIYDFDMEPIRKSDGVDKNKKKRYKRFFKINEIKKLTNDININDDKKYANNDDKKYVNNDDKKYVNNDDKKYANNDDKKYANNIIDDDITN